MRRKNVLHIALSGAIGIAPVSAKAQDAEAFVGGLLGGVLGGAIMNEVNRSESNAARERERAAAARRERERERESAAYRAQERERAREAERRRAYEAGKRSAAEQARWEREEEARLRRQRQAQPRQPSAAPRQAAPRPAAPAVNIAEREANREVQTALNHFGFNVGTPDGSLGPRSRSGISQLQALLGYSPTGHLTDFERTILMGAYQQALVGGPGVMQVASTHPQGMRGVLVMQRDMMSGVPMQGMGGQMMANAPQGMMPNVMMQQQPVPQMAMQPMMAAGQYGVSQMQPAQPPVAMAAPIAEPAPAPAPAPVEVAAPAPAPVAAPVVVAAAAPAAPAMPNFFGAAAQASNASLASHCNKVSLVTNTNGGFVTSVNMTDPTQALAEQFCLARTYAMAQGEELSQRVPGNTPQQVNAQCAELGPMMAEHVNALSLQDRATVLRGVSAFILETGMAPAQLTATAQICLGSGYTTDKLDVALGSGLLLTAMGQSGYAELLGHHLSQGYGVSKRADLALDWYEAGLSAGAGGATVFAPGMPDRADLIRKAAYTIIGKAPAAAAPASPGFAVPAMQSAPAGGAAEKPAGAVH